MMLPIHLFAIQLLLKDEEDLRSVKDIIKQKATAPNSFNYDIKFLGQPQNLSLY